MAGRRSDHTGKTFGTLTVLKFHGADKKGKSLWLCHCSACGKEKVMQGHYLTRSYVVSCGCRMGNVQHDRRWSREYSLWSQAARRARKKGIPFSISVQDVVIPPICPIFSVPFELEKHPHVNMPSLDRVVPSLGYVKENVWVISYRANAIKNDASLEELSMLVDKLRERIS